jgi:hypothetical protein
MPRSTDVQRIMKKHHPNPRPRKSDKEISKNVKNMYREREEKYSTRRGKREKKKEMSKT